jgi:hypothetical protein
MKAAFEQRVNENYYLALWCVGYGLYVFTLIANIEPSSAPVPAGSNGLFTPIITLILMLSPWIGPPLAFYQGAKNQRNTLDKSEIKKAFFIGLSCMVFITFFKLPDYSPSRLFMVTIYGIWGGSIYLGMRYAVLKMRAEYG